MAPHNRGAKVVLLFDMVKCGKWECNRFLRKGNFFTKTTTKTGLIVKKRNKIEELDKPEDGGIGQELGANAPRSRLRERARMHAGERKKIREKGTKGAEERTGLRKRLQ